MMSPELLCLIFIFENKLIFNYTYHIKAYIYIFFCFNILQGKKNLVFFFLITENNQRFAKDCYVGGCNTWPLASCQTHLMCSESPQTQMPSCEISQIQPKIKKQNNPMVLMKLRTSNLMSGL